MIDFLEINYGITVRKDSIQTIERINDTTCKVITSTGAYESMYPSWWVLMQLGKDIDKPTVVAGTPEKVNLWGNQYFAG